MGEGGEGAREVLARKALRFCIKAFGKLEGVPRDLTGTCLARMAEKVLAEL